MFGSAPACFPPTWPALIDLHRRQGSNFRDPASEVLNSDGIHVRTMDTHVVTKHLSRHAKRKFAVVQTLLTPAQGCRPCAPISRLLLGSSDLRATTLWVGPQVFGVRIDGRLEMRDLEHWAPSHRRNRDCSEVCHRGYNLTQKAPVRPQPVMLASEDSYHGVPLSAPPRLQTHHQVTEEGKFEPHRVPQRDGVPTTRPNKLVRCRRHRQQVSTAQRDKKCTHRESCPQWHQSRLSVSTEHPALGEPGHHRAREVLVTCWRQSSTSPSVVCTSSPGSPMGPQTHRIELILK